ncbi:MAG TPA: tetratricopeptide repeat protein [Bryobacteraceae bacterium]|nr:tetratricopeptide repeat protein [Bryobacteraceae bacterium]
MWFVVLAFLAQSADFSAQGLKALDERRYADAAALFSQVVAQDQKDYSAHFNLALAYSMLSRDAEAIQEYQKVLDLKPGLYEAELNLGLSLVRNKDAAAAIPLFRSAMEQKPKEFRPRLYLGDALFATQQFADSEAAYRAALELDANSAPAELGLGRALAHEKQLSQAEPHYRKAAAIEPSYKDAPLELAALYEDNKQTPEAVAIYRQFPENPGAQERLGALLLESGQATNAIAPLEAAVAASPTPANRLALAQAYVKEKQLAKAEPLAAQAAAASPEDLELRLFYARLLRDQRKFPQAAAQFLAVAQAKPDSVEAWTELSGVYMASEQYQQALAPLDRIRSLGAESNGLVFIRALAYDHLQQRKEALENYNKFLAASHGEHPDQEFQARQRVRMLEKDLGKR